MLQLTIPTQELWYEDERTRRFIPVKGQTIKLEHSLMSISKWESKWKKAFLSPLPRTPEEIMDYIECMTLTPDVDPNVYKCLTSADIAKVQGYIDDPMTATTFRGEKEKKGGRSRVTTSERIYAAMVDLGIPFECQKWHLNRLLTLIHECQIHSSRSGMNRRDSAKYMRGLNAARKSKYHTKG